MGIVLKRPVAKKFKIWQEFWEIRPETTYAYAEVFGGHHPGVDFFMEEGNEVYCSFEGIVVRREWHKGMGNVLGIRNGNIIALYAHLSAFKVNLGQVVMQGELIGVSGNTGAATFADVPHLHFELRDLTKPTLLEMVFKPVYDVEISQWVEEFTYLVNNKNSKKTWELLAERYFGDEQKADLLRQHNMQITDLDDGVMVTIPNFQSI